MKYLLSRHRGVGAGRFGVSGLVLLTLTAWVSLALAAKGPFEYSDEELADIDRSFASLGTVVLDESFDYEISYDSKHDVIEGQERVRRAFLLRTRDAAEAARAFSVIDDTNIELTKAEFYVRATDGKVRKLDEGDLEWVEWVPEGRGIVQVDATQRNTDLGRLRAGEVLMVDLRRKLRRWHGAPSAIFGGHGVLRTRVSLKLKSKEADLQVRLRPGVEPGDPDGVHYTSAAESKSGRHEWDYHATREDALDGATIRLNTHVVHPDGGMAAAPDWRSAGDALLAFFGDRFDPDDRVRRAAEEVVAAAPNDRRRQIDLIYREVQKSCRYLGLYSGRGGILPDPAPEVLAEGHSDCKGLGGLLISMLRSVGIDSSPVLLHTDDGVGISPELANPAQFNHFIVWADDGSEDGVWLDGTTDARPAGALPWGDRVDHVLLVQPGNSRLVTIPMSMWNRGSREIRLAVLLSRRFELTGTLHELSKGEPAVLQRYMDEKLTGNELEDARIEQFASPAHLFRIRVREAGRTKGDDYIVSCDVSSVSPLANTAGQVFLPRTLLAFETPKTSDLIEDGASTLVRQVDRDEEWRVTLPPGMHLDASVESTFEAEFLSWRSEAVEMGGELVVKRRLEWKPGAEIGDPDEWRRAYRKMQRAESGQIALRFEESR